MAKKKVRKKATKRARAPKKVAKVRSRPGPSKRGRLPLVPMALFVVSACMLLGGTIVPWGGLDVETKLGIIPVSLKADVYEYGVSYEADLSGTDILPTGGAGGKIKDDRVFLTGLGDFQETIGFVKGSAKTKNHTIELYTLPDNNNAKVLIETNAASIPWWPVGVPQDIKVIITVLDDPVPVNMTHVEIKKVWFELHRTIDGEDAHKVVWEKTVNEKIKKAGGSRSYSTKVTVDDDWGPFSIVGRAQLDFIDSAGVSNNGKELRSYANNPKMIDLWTISQEKIVRIVLMVAAFPVTLLSAVLLILSLMPAYLRKGWAWKLAAAGAILALLAIIFYMMGVDALITLTGYIDWFEYNPLGLGVAFAGVAVAMASTGLMYLARPRRLPRKRTKKKVAKAKKKKGPEKRRTGPNAPTTEEDGDKGIIPTEGPDRPTTSGLEADAWMPDSEE